jgi:hypothetical protein
MSARDFVVKPLSAIPPDAKLGWEPILGDGQVVGFRNPGVMSVTRVGMFEGDHFKYDFCVIEDGPQDENGVATPGVMLVPVREDGGRMIVGALREWRPVIRDPETGKMGVEIVGLPGGFAKKAGQKPEDVASYQGLSEMGIEVLEVIPLGQSSANRAYIPTCICYFAVKYRIVAEAKPEGLESIIGAEEIPLSDFPLGLDGIVNTAIAFAWQRFGK